MSLFLFLFFLLSLFFSFFFPPKKLSSVAIHIVFLSWFLSFKIFFLLHSRWWYSVSCFLNPCSVSHFSDCHSTRLFFAFQILVLLPSLSLSLSLFLNLFTLASLFLSRAFFFLFVLYLSSAFMFSCSLSIILLVAPTLLIIIHSLSDPHLLDHCPFSWWPWPPWSLSIFLLLSPDHPSFNILLFTSCLFFFISHSHLPENFHFPFSFFFFFHFHLPSFYRTN